MTLADTILEERAQSGKLPRNGTLLEAVIMEMRDEFANHRVRDASESRPPGLTGITHSMIREFVAHLHDHGLKKSSIARKLAALRSFFKYCVREGHLQENPARLVPTPKLPKRIPSVLSAEEMNGFLNQLGGSGH